MRRAFAALIALAAAAFAGEANAERYCSVPGSGPPNCSYANLEQCRAANAGAGRCSPISWIEPAKPARRAAAPASGDGYPRMLIDPPTPVRKSATTVVIDRDNMGW